MLEEQKEEQGIGGEEKRKFCGTWITWNEEDVNLKVMTRNVNEESVMMRERQSHPRYLDASAWVDPRYKNGLLIGNLHRINSQTTLTRDLFWAVEVNYREMKVCGYTDIQYERALRKVANRYER